MDNYYFMAEQDSEVKDSSSSSFNSDSNDSDDDDRICENLTSSQQGRTGLCIRRRIPSPIKVGFQVGVLSLASHMVLEPTLGWGTTLGRGHGPVPCPITWACISYWRSSGVGGDLGYI